MVTGCAAGGEFLTGEDGADRKAAGEALSNAHDVGLDAVLLVRPERPRAPDAGLDLVENEQQPFSSHQRRTPSR